MKVLHVIEIEFEEEVDDNKIGGGSPEEVAAAAHCYKEDVEALCAKMEADGLKKCTEIYGLKKRVCMRQIFRELAELTADIANKIDEEECKEEKQCV